MEGGNTNEYANLIRQTNEYGNPVVTESGREGLNTNVGYATGGAGCHYDFGDTTGVVGFGAAATYLNQSGATDVGGDTNTVGGGGGNEQRQPTGVVDGGRGGCTSVPTKETANK
ncbi:hypothetical protein L6452_40802 [Arctium lappa]|uniref:Uncharacterized protein n=1 Tax=Arctium lappa TaxID=4217 RepID=A0ACB8XMX3_ARCLA|nr:hypothetical protein L6452_40802 [Arctium lappa]